MGVNMYYVLIENTNCTNYMEMLEFKDSKQADIAKLIIQTYFYNIYVHKHIYILDEKRYRVEQLSGKKKKYNLPRSWYNSLRRDVKKNIIINPVIR